MNRVWNSIAIAMLGCAFVLSAPALTSAQEEGRHGHAVRGKIAAISGSTIDITRRDESTVTVETTPETRFSIAGEPATLADFDINDGVTARVRPNGSGGVVAVEVRGRGSRPPAEHARMAGRVASVDVAEGSITITRRDGGTAVIYTTAETHVLKNRQPATVADFVEGDRVKAHGETDPNGQFIADRVLGGTPRDE